MIPSRLTVLVCMMPLVGWAGTSVDYSLEPAVLDAGGQLVSSADYAVDSSIGDGEVAASATYGLRAGFAGMLMDPVSLDLVAADSGGLMDERSTLQLTARIRYDDDSLDPSVLDPEQVVWVVSAGPLAGIGSDGLVTAGSVYKETLARVGASWMATDGWLEITVRNVTNDDFGSYASDGLADAWQVRYFGEESPQAGAAANPDGDALSNLQEFAFGTDPSLSSGASVQWSGNTVLAAGLPVPYATNGLKGFSFRAVFSRRKDFATAGLSYTVEFSGDLTSWRASTSIPSVLADDGEIQVVSVPYPFFVNGRKANYFRVKVQSQ